MHCPELSGSIEGEYLVVTCLKCIKVLCFVDQPIHNRVHKYVNHIKIPVNDFFNRATHKVTKPVKYEGNKKSMKWTWADIPMKLKRQLIWYLLISTPSQLVPRDFKLCMFGQCTSFHKHDWTDDELRD